MSKSSTMSNIAWGGLIVGASVAVAAVVGFVFFPGVTGSIVEGSKEAITGIYDKIGTIGEWLTANVVGRGTEGTMLKSVQDAITNSYDAIREAGIWVGDNVIGSFDGKAYASTFAQSMKDQAAESQKIVASVANSKNAGGVLGFLQMIGDNTGITYLTSHAMTAPTHAVADAAALKVAGPHGLVNLIVHNKILAGAAAALGAYGISQSVQKDPAESDEYKARLRDANESFAIKEDIRKMQMVMAIQAAAAGHPGAQAFIAQQQMNRS